MISSASTSPPDIRARLGAIEASLDRVERALTSLAVVTPTATALVAEAPRLGAMATDVFDSVVADLPDADARLRALLAFALRASRPETLDALTRGLDLLESAPHAVAAGIDVFDAVIGQAAADGADVSALFGVATRFGRHLIALGPAVDRLIDSGMLDARTLDTLGRVARAMGEQADAPPEQIGGVLSLLGAMRDPDVRQALGFALGLARRFGATPDTPRALAR